MEIRSHLKPLKLQHKNLYQNLDNRELLRKMHMELEIPSCLGMVQKALMFKVTMHRLKSMLLLLIDTAI